MVMGAADHADIKRIPRNCVCPVFQGSIDFRPSIQMKDGGSDALTCFRLYSCFIKTVGVHHRLNNFPIARTTAKDATQRIFHLFSGWGGVLFEQGFRKTAR